MKISSLGGKKNLKRLMIMAVLLLFISGCTTLQNISKPSWLGKKEFVSGKGLTPGFLVEMPPLDKIYEGQEFQVGVKVTNHGLSDASGEICVSDGLSSYYGGIPSKQNTCIGFNIDSAERSTTGQKIIPSVEKFFFPGDRSYYIYTGLISDTTTGIESEIRYDYQTTFDSQVCISKKEDDPCNSAAIKIDDSVRSAPITITKINKDVLPTPPGLDEVKFILEIYVSNSGGGKIYDEWFDSKDQFFDMDITLESAGSINCNPKKEGKFFLEDNGRVIITCEIISSFDGDYINDPFGIVLSYPYKISQETKKITIKHKEY